MVFKGTFTYQTLLTSPIDEVWTFFQSAENLVRITSFPKINIKGSPDVVVGQTIFLELNFLLWRTSWDSSITQWKEKELFEDVIAEPRFPFSSWNHLHQFSAKSVNETLMVDRVVFTSPLPPWMIKIGLYFMFKDRDRILKKYFKEISS